MHLHAAIKIHTVDANGRVVFDSQIDVFTNAKSEIARFRKILLLELIFLDLEATLEDFFCLGSSHGDMDSNLFVTTDPKGTDSVAGLAFSSDYVRVGFWVEKIW